MVADRAAVAAARGLTRRRLLRNVSGAALGATVATAYVGTRTARSSHCGAGSYEGPCGPAPLCGPSRCTSGGLSCNAANGVTWARWESGQAPCDLPDGSLYDNCWCEGGIRCCDCCVASPGCKDYRC